MRIGELGDRTNLSPKTIRYYEEIGLLPDPGRTPAGYREYGDDALERLGFIRSAQAIGFTLGEIREILDFRLRGEAPCEHVTELMERRVRSLSEHLRRLGAMKEELSGLVAKARILPKAESKGFCHIIEGASGQGRSKALLPLLAERSQPK